MSPPLQDVTDNLDDPDFSDTFVVVRPGVVATSGGTAAETDQRFKAYGVVTPASSDMLQLLPEGTLQKGAIEIITRFRLQTGAGQGFEPDVIVWHNANYTVLSVMDWSGFGQGFVQATAQLRDVNPPVPG